MAKKGARQLVGLICAECKSQNYVTERNRTNTPDKLELNKYCPNCDTRTIHKEKKKLK